MTDTAHALRTPRHGGRHSKTYEDVNLLWIAGTGW